MNQAQDQLFKFACSLTVCLFFCLCVSVRFILFHKHWHCLVMKMCDIGYVLSLHFSFTSKNVNWSFVNSFPEAANISS